MRRDVDVGAHASDVNAASTVSLAKNNVQGAYRGWCRLSWHFDRNSAEEILISDDGCDKKRISTIFNFDGSNGSNLWDNELVSKHPRIIYIYSSIKRIASKLLHEISKIHSFTNVKRAALTRFMSS